MIHKHVSNILCCEYFFTQIILKKIALPNWQCKYNFLDLHCQIGNANQKKNICIAKLAMQIKKNEFALPIWQCNFFC